MAHLSLGVLGSLQVLLDDTPVTLLESDKVRALLAYLAVEADSPHRRESLVGLLWPDHPEQDARHNLRQALHNLRLAIDDHNAKTPHLLISRDAIQFNPASDFSLDLARFNAILQACKENRSQGSEDPSIRAARLEELVKLYRGEFLQGFSLGDSAEFEEWTLVQRENLRQHVLEACSELAIYCELHGDFPAARRHSLRQLELDPWSEEAHCQLMRALALDGQRSAALAQYETCRRVLAKELGVEPSATTRELVEQIRKGTLKAKGASPSTPAAPIHNLPVSLTSFLGRDQELVDLDRLIANPECRCISLVGPGGIGKTRLALQAAEQHRADFAHGIVFVPLASVGSVEAAIPAITSAIHLNFYGPNDPRVQLLNYLKEKQMLLILDNVEQLLVEGSLQANFVELILEILQHAPGIKLLVTSREVLNLLGEWIYEVRGLTFPAAEQAERLDEFAAVALFIQRARRASPGFVVNETGLAGIAQLCRLVEGMPLAIELAATWVRLLSPPEIAKEIEGSLDALSASVRDLPERHRSMRVVFDRSWQRLSAREQQVLSQLSVFRGGFSRAAAEEVAGASLPVLSTLVNRTLVRRAAGGRYDLHELVRQYAGLKLSEDPGEQEQAKDRHATYYVHCLSEWEKALKSSRQLETFDKMAQVIDNLSQAWQHMVTTCRPGLGERNQFRADLLHRSLFSLSYFYEERCRSLDAISLFKGSVETLKTVKAEFEETKDRTCFTSVLGNITAHLGLHLIFVLKTEEARKNLEEALQLLEDSQSRVEKAQAQLMMSEIDYIQGQVQKSAALLEQSREVFRQEGEDWWYLWSTIELASTYINTGKLGESKELFLEGFRLIQPGDLRLELRLRYGYASLLFLLNDFAQAEPLMYENLQLSYQLGNDRLTAYILYDLGRLALATDRIELAVEHLRKSINLLGKFGESHEMARFHLYLGKCFAAQTDLHAARDQFQQVIKTGQALDMFYLIYWGLVNIARTYMVEGQTGRALEISLTLKHCPMEHKRVQEEGDRLLAELQAMLPKEQVEAATKQVNGKISADQSGAAALAYALEQVTE